MGRARVWLVATTLGMTVAGGWTSFRGAEPSLSQDAAAFWKVGEPVPIAVRGERTTFRVPNPGPDAELLVVVSALAAGQGTFPVELTARSVDMATVPELAVDTERNTPAPDRAAHDALDRSSSIEIDSPPARSFPPPERRFWLMVRDGDVAIASNYAPLTGILRGVGNKVQIYVASEDVSAVDPELIKDLITTFDDRVYPLAAARFGVARDVDRDGRFTILLSSWLSHLGYGRDPVDGFVRVADLDRGFESPFGNQCDMMYLSATLRAGPHVRTVLAHEYMHAVIFSQKSAGGAALAGAPLEEEGWLDEAIAHLAEDLHGFSTSNIDYRVSAYLSRPERYQLVVEDYYAANLFRSHGNRGSTYLFLRWCADQFGPELIRDLVSSRRHGVANLESATGMCFASLYRRWSLAVYASGLHATDGPLDPGAGHFTSMNLRAPRDDSDFTGPRYERLSPAIPVSRWTAAGTTSHFIVIDGFRSPAIEVEVAGPIAAEIQVTALPLGTKLARLDLSLRPSRGPGGTLRLRARINERHGVPARLSALSWEPLVPSADPRSDETRRGRLDMLGIAAAFGTSAIPPGGELRSTEIPLPNVTTQTGPLVVKVIGTDTGGRRIVGWAELNDEQSDPADEP